MKKNIFVLLLPLILFQAVQAQPGRLSKGDRVPPFALRDQDSSLFNSKDYTGKRIMVIYFYPKDESSVCTKEACSFRDRFADFTRLGAMVIGINAGTVASHKDFQQHHHLPFILLSDPGNKVLKRFGVKNKFVFTGRETFIVDLSGKIVFTFRSFSHGTQHMEESLGFIESLKRDNPGD